MTGNKNKLLLAIWSAASIVLLTAVVVFSVCTAKAVGVRGERGELPASLSSATSVTDAACGDGFAVAATESGSIVCYDGSGGEMWSYARPLSGSEGNARVTSVNVLGGEIFATFEDRTVCRFAPSGDGTAAGVLATNYAPQSIAFDEDGGTLMAVMGSTGGKKEVYLLRTDFGGSEESPASWRSYTKLDGGEYATSRGGVETGVQGVLVAGDTVYVASDAYTVRKFTSRGMDDGYDEYTVRAEKLAAFTAYGDGFAGVDTAGNYWRFDSDFAMISSARISAGADSVRKFSGVFYIVNGDTTVAVTAGGGKLFTLGGMGKAVDGNGDAVLTVSGAKPRFYTHAHAANIASWGGKSTLFICLLCVSAALLAYAVISCITPARRAVNGAFATLGKTLARHRFAYLGLIPALALLAVFYYWPILQGFALSVFDYNGVVKVFVGFDNFKAVLHNAVFWKSSLTMLILLATDLLKALIPPFFFAEFILALRSKRYSFAVRVLLFIPGILPGVASTLVWTDGIFGSGSYGLLNSICSLFVPGFVRTWIGPFLETRSLVAIIMFGFPWVGSYLIFYGGVMSISKSLFEASELDGCGWWRRVFVIDLPMIFAQVKYIFITSFIASVQDYGRLFITNQSTGHGLKVPALIIYEYIYGGGSEPNYGLSSAMSIFLFLFLLTATILNFRKQKEDLR